MNRTWVLTYFYFEYNKLVDIGDYNIGNTNVILADLLISNGIPDHLHHTYFSLELPIVVNECAEFQRQFHLLHKILRRGILVERFLDLDELGGPVHHHHITFVGRGEKMVPGGRASEGSVLRTVGL